MKLPSYAAVIALTFLLVSAAPAQLVRSAAGPNAAAIQGSVDQFRLDLGTLNPNVVGSFGSGRREINWDGVPDAFAAPNLLPPNFFNANSPRGAVFAGPGAGFQVSANVGVAPVQFDNLDPSYSSTFEPFSPQRLFTPIASNVVDVLFFVPGLGVPALVRGFGAVFSDVDLANTTSIQLFDKLGASLGTFFAPNFAGANESFSFLGISFADPTISRVRIVNGNAPLGPGILDQNGNPNDLVVMDDFIFGEPIAPTAVPEGSSLALMSGGLLGLLGWRRLLRKRSTD
jgi:hypothetical protein